MVHGITTRGARGSAGARRVSVESLCVRRFRRRRRVSAVRLGYGAPRGMESRPEGRLGPAQIIWRAKSEVQWKRDAHINAAALSPTPW